MKYLILIVTVIGFSALLLAGCSDDEAPQGPVSLKDAVTGVPAPKRKPSPPYGLPTASEQASEGSWKDYIPELPSVGGVTGSAVTKEDLDAEFNEPFEGK